MSKKLRELFHNGQTPHMSVYAILDVEGDMPRMAGHFPVPANTDELFAEVIPQTVAGNLWSAHCLGTPYPTIFPSPAGKPVEGSATLLVEYFFCMNMLLTCSIKGKEAEFEEDHLPFLHTIHHDNALLFRYFTERIAEFIGDGLGIRCSGPYAIAVKFANAQAISLADKLDRAFRSLSAISKAEKAQGLVDSILCDRDFHPAYPAKPFAILENSVKDAVTIPDGIQTASLEEMYKILANGVTLR